MRTLQTNPFHLGLFLQGSSVQAWGEPWTGRVGESWMQPKLFIDVAQALERACFDYILLEDSSYIGESYAASREIYLHNGIAVPRQDPSVVASLMTAATSRIGIVPTFATFAYPPYLLARLVATLDQVSAGRIGWNMVTGSSDFAARVPTFATFAYPPYLLARLVATLDQVSAGRIGWNMVTGSSDFAARNFGLDGLPDHDLRYDMADEYMDLVGQLWASWEPGALVADTESGMLVDIPRCVRWTSRAAGMPRAAR